MSRAQPTAGEHICLAPQPRSVFGTPDTMVQRGVAAMLAQTARLAAAIIRAVAGKTNAKAIGAAITAAAKRFGSASIARTIERELLHGAMLGALDADHETATGRPVQIERFAADTSFAQRPIKEAMAAFLKKKAVTRESFDAMTKDAQRRAFTVAGAANAEMVRTVKRELLRQVAVGADFADFGKNAAKRFEAAGWMPANPSHVETVFRTNVMGAYSGGRVRQMSNPEVLAVRPFWQSLPVGDGPPRQRKAHRMFVLRAADPFWQSACPPYGYNCRCRLRSLSIKQGAGLVQEGSSIHGLPDPGFTSGVSTLFEGGGEPSREPPANDTGGQAPAPANDPPPKGQPANDAPDRSERLPPPASPTESMTDEEYRRRAQEIRKKHEALEKARRKPKPVPPHRPPAPPPPPPPPRKSDFDSEARRVERQRKRDAEVERQKKKAEQKARVEERRRKRDPSPPTPKPRPPQPPKPEPKKVAPQPKADDAIQREIDDLKKRIDDVAKAPTSQREIDDLKKEIEDIKKSPEVRGTPAQQIEKQGARLDMVGSITESEQQAAIDGMKKLGFGKERPIAPAVRVRPLAGIQMTTRIGSDNGSLSNVLPDRTGGAYYKNARMLRLGTAPEHIGEIRKFKFKTKDPFFPGNVADVATSREKAIEITACHEYAHHLHRASAAGSPIDSIISKAFADPDRQHVSEYAKINHAEFFAESTAAYHYYPRPWLLKHAPKTVKMVEEILKLQGLL